MRNQCAGQREEGVSESAAGQGCLDGQDNEQRGKHEIQSWDVDGQAAARKRARDAAADPGGVHEELHGQDAGAGELAAGRAVVSA